MGTTENDPTTSDPPPPQVSRRRHSVASSAQSSSSSTNPITRRSEYEIDHGSSDYDGASSFAAAAAPSPSSSSVQQLRPLSYPRRKSETAVAAEAKKVVFDEVAGGKRRPSEHTRLAEEERACKRRRTTEEPAIATSDLTTSGSLHPSATSTLKNETSVSVEARKGVVNEVTIEQVPTKADPNKVLALMSLLKQKSAVTFYVGRKTDKGINGILRGRDVGIDVDKEYFAEKIQHLTRALSSEGSLNLVTCGPISGPPPFFAKRNSREYQELGADVLYRGVDSKSYISDYASEDGYFCDPGFLSTSKDIEVAQQYAGKDGIIISLKTSKKSPEGRILRSGKMLERLKSALEEVLFPPSTVFRIENITDHEVILCEIDTEE